MFEDKVLNKVFELMKETVNTKLHKVTQLPGVGRLVKSECMRPMQCKVHIERIT
jgi:hypothetical protein